LFFELPGSPGSGLPILISGNQYGLFGLGVLMVKIDQTSPTKKSADMPAVNLSLVVKPEVVPIFFQLLGQGFSVNFQTGCSVKELLCSQLGIHEDYLAERIQTIFLNAKVVDDVNSAIVNEGATLALSGAMPGLIGAILRSGGFYASMRSQISYDKNLSTSQRGDGQVVIKLFNLVLKELGPVFLQQGIRIESKNLHDLLYQRLAEIETGCISGEFDGKPVKINNILEIDWDDGPVILQVTSEKVE
jgi:hypothetical protein